MKKVVFIIGTGHCGSTLLDLVLGSHCDAFSLGELYSTLVPAKPRTDSLGLCGICAGRCRFWDDLVDRERLQGHFGARPIHNRLVRMLLQNIRTFRIDIFHHLFDCTQQSVLIDSSKLVSYVKRELRAVWRWRDIVPYFLYVTRDGRAVANSILRIHPEREITQVAQDWASQVLELERFFMSTPRERRRKVSYEQFCTNPVQVTAELCQWLGLEYQPEMLRYWRAEHHLIAGNLGPRLLIFKFREQFDDTQTKYWSKINQGNKHADKEFYEQLGLSISLDQRWVEELSLQQRTQFEEYAGLINRSYAYEDPSSQAVRLSGD